MNFFDRIKEYFINHWIRLLFCFIYGIIVLVLYLLGHDNKILVSYCDGLFIAGATLILFGLLVLVTYFGALDIFSYAFNSKRINGKKETLYDYEERKKIERKPNSMNFIDYILVGAFYVLIALIIFLFV